MSRQILNDHLWTPDEVQYKLDRHLIAEVEQNRLEFSGKQPEEIAPEEHSLQLDQDIFEHVNGLDLEHLKAALKESGLDTTGEVPVLKKRLAQAYQDSRDGDSNG
jgi:hypothetical protein